MKIVIHFLIILLVVQSKAISQEYKIPQDLGASVAKMQSKKSNRVSESENKSLSKINTASRSTSSGEISGTTFMPVAFDENLDINQLTMSDSRKHLDRNLFGNPQYTANYYYTEYDSKYNLVENTYIQIVSDSKWDRVLYGSLNGELKSYKNIDNPGEIVTNSAGNVFIADRANSKVQVLKIKGKEKEITLNYMYSIGNLGAVSSIAYNDGGSPFDLTDDYLYVADASSNSIYQYKLGENSATRENVFSKLKWPSSITFGRENGGNTNRLYVIDNYSKRITLYEVVGDELEV